MGVPGRIPAGVELLVGGRNASVLGGARAWLGRVPVGPDEEVARFLPVSGGVIVQVARLDGRASSTIYFVARQGSVTKLAEADSVAVSLDRKRVFALNRSARTSGGPGRLLEVDLTGQVVRRWSTSAELWLETDSTEGLVVSEFLAQPNGGTQIRVLDHRTLHIRRRLGSVARVISATSHTVAAWPARCAGTCKLLLIDIVDGRQRQVRTAAGFTVGTVALRPDGARLAVGYFGRSYQQPGGRARGFVDVVDVRTGVSQRVPGVGSGVKHTAELAWLPDGWSLALGVDLPDDVRRIGLWSLRSRRVALVPGTFSAGGLLAV